MDALIVSNIVLWILLDRTRARGVRADAPDRRVARAARAGRGVDVGRWHQGGRNWRRRCR